MRAAQSKNEHVIGGQGVRTSFAQCVYFGLNWIWCYI